MYPLIDDFIAWLKAGHSHATAQSYADALRSFRKWLNGRDILFISLDTKDMGQPIGKCVVQRLFRKLRIKVGITKKVSPHSCRHGFATNAVRKNANLSYLQEMLGHANIKSTMVYVHAKDKDIQDEYKRLFDEGEKES